MENEVVIGAGLLFDSIRLGRLKSIRFILEAVEGDLVNTRDIKGRTPLMTCCFIREELNRGQTFNLILKYGGDPNCVDDDGRDALSHACETRCNDLVGMLIKCNINPDIIDNNGNTPLIYSAQVANDVAIDLLIRHFRRLGLNVDHANKDGFTALLMAAKMGNSHCAEILVLKGKASLLHRDRIHGMSADEWLLTHGISLRDTLEYACKVAKLNRVRKVLSVIQTPKKPRGFNSKTQITEKSKSDSRSQTTGLSTERRMSLPCDKLRMWETDSVHSANHLELVDQHLLAPTKSYAFPFDNDNRARIKRSSSLCAPVLESSSEKPTKTRVSQMMSVETPLELETLSHQLNQLSFEEGRKRKKVERSAFDTVLHTLGDSDDSEYASDIQNTPKMTVEELDEEIAALF